MTTSRKRVVTLGHFVEHVCWQDVFGGVRSNFRDGDVGRPGSDSLVVMHRVTTLQGAVLKKLEGRRGG